MVRGEADDNRFLRTAPLSAGCLRPYSIDVQTAILLRLAFEACCGDLQAIQLWLDRKYGKVTQPLDVEAKTGPLVAILNAPQGDQQVTVKPPPANPG